MSGPLEERVRRALATRIRIDAEAGYGGMGVVYRGRHLALDTPVAVKVLRPELWSTEAEERFRQEARTMAQFRHPNIIPVQDLFAPEEVDGLSVLTMPFIEGESLAERLTRERLSAQDARILGLQLLDALAEVHRRGVVHRDVKPGNLVYDQERQRWILTDFGIAKVPRGIQTDPGIAHGTQEYMPPDKDEWRQVTRQTDLYAAAATIFEAYTAEPWNPNTTPTSAGWQRIPGPQSRTLKKGTSPSAKNRWRTAEEFREAFRGTGGGLPWKLSIGAAALAVIGLVTYNWRHHPAPSIDLALATFSASEGAVATRAGDLRQAVYADLRAVLDTDPDTVTGCGADPRIAHCVTGQVEALPPDSLNVTLELRAGGRREVATVGPDRELSGMAGRVVVAILAHTGHQSIVDECRLGSAPTGNVCRACQEYRLGVAAFQGDNWPAANLHFRQAIELNPTLADGLWRLYTTDVWRREDPGSALVRLVQVHRQDLSEMDRLLFDAQLTRQGADRNAGFERAVRRYPWDALPALLYGSELFHRGSLAGVTLDSSAAVLRRAVAADSGLSEAYDQLLWVLIRTGKRAAAESTFARYPSGSPGPLALKSALQLAAAARFHPGSLSGATSHLDPQTLRTLRQTFRFGLSLDIPDAEALLGDVFARDTALETRSDGHEGQGLGLLTMGKLRAGLAHIDSAAIGDAGRLEAAEWRVIPAALGVFTLPEPERERGRVTLRTLARRPGTLGARAAWALAVDARMRGDARTAAMWETALSAGNASDSVRRLRSLVAGVAAGARGGFREALRLSRDLPLSDEAPLVADPFARAVLHLSRGRWELSLGDTAAAQREWRWSENADLQGWSSGPAQAAEVDLVFGSYVRTAQARLAAPRCLSVARVDSILADADRDLFPAADSARLLARSCRP